MTLCFTNVNSAVWYLHLYIYTYLTYLQDINTIFDFELSEIRI